MTTATLTNFVIPNIGFQRLVALVITRLHDGRKQTHRREKRVVRYYSYVSENLLDPHLGPEMRRIQR